MEVNQTLTIETKYAGFWIRFAALLLDSIALTAFSIVLKTLLGNSLINSSLGFQLIELLVGITYFVGLTVHYGQTLGKMAVGIMVIQSDRGPNAWGTIILRETIGKFLSSIILLIGYIMAAFDPQKQALHDRIARTYVVKV